MFPAIEPYDSGMLPVGNRHRIYWECCGNPKGKPALFLHGGPGSGCTPGQRRFFDPLIYRAVLLDQRGSGRSRPLAHESDADLSTNTTADLIGDIECLREHLCIESWTVLGMSWGTTLGLAYAQRHPRRVNALVLALLTTTSRREVEWVTHDVGRIFPEQWARFAAVAVTEEEKLALADVYARLLFDPKKAVRDHAALEWCAWEDAHVSLIPGYVRNQRFNDPDFRLRFARLVTHYWSHAAFLDDEQLLRDAGILNGIPGVLIHG